MADNSGSEAVTWVEFFDPDGDPYYYRVDTGDTTREKPTEDGVKFITEEEYLGSQQSDAKSVTSDGIDDWQEFTADDGDKYYYSQSRNESRWQKPVRKGDAAKTTGEPTDHVNNSVQLEKALPRASRVSGVVLDLPKPVHRESVASIRGSLSTKVEEHSTAESIVVNPADATKTAEDVKSGDSSVGTAKPSSIDSTTDALPRNGNATHGDTEVSKQPRNENMGKSPAELALTPHADSVVGSVHTPSSISPVTLAPGPSADSKQDKLVAELQAKLEALTVERDSLQTQSANLASMLIAAEDKIVALNAQLSASELRCMEFHKRADDAETKLNALMKASASSAAAAAAVKRGVARQDSNNIMVGDTTSGSALMRTASRIAGWKTEADAESATSAGADGSTDGVEDAAAVQSANSKRLPLVGARLRTPTPGFSPRLEPATAPKTASITLSQLSFLKSVPLFHSFPEDKFMRLAAKFQKVDFPAGQLILRQGDPPDGFFYVIESGKVAVHVKTAPTAAPPSTMPSATLTARASSSQFPETLSGSSRTLPTGPTLRRLEGSNSRDEASSNVSPPGTRLRLVSAQSSVDVTPTNSPQAPSGFPSPLQISARAPSQRDSDNSHEDADSDDDVLSEDVGPLVAELSKGMFFGERALMTSEPRAATCIARTDVTLYALDRKAFEEVLSSVSNFLGDYSRQNYRQETPETICLARYVHCFKTLLETAEAHAIERPSTDVAQNPALRATVQMMSLIAPELSITDVAERLREAVKSSMDVEYAEIFLVDQETGFALIKSPIGRPGVFDGSHKINYSSEIFLTPELLEDARQALVALGGESCNDGSVRVPLQALGASAAVLQEKTPIIANHIRDDERFATVDDGGRSWLDSQRLLDKLLCISDGTCSLAVSAATDADGIVLAVLFVANKMKTRLNGGGAPASGADKGRARSICNAPHGVFDDADAEILLSATDTLAITLCDKRIELDVLLSNTSFMPLSELADLFHVNVQHVSGLPLPGMKPPRSLSAKDVDRAAARAADKAAIALQKNKVLGSIVVSVYLFHGSQVISDSRTEAAPLMVASDGTTTTCAAWNSTVSTPIQMCNLPFATRVIFNVTLKDGTPVGWAGCSVFTSQQVLINGPLTLKLWPGNINSENITRVTNLSNSLGDESTPELTVSFRHYDRTVVRMDTAFAGTATSSLKMRTISQDYASLRATPTEFGALEKLVSHIVHQDPLYEMKAEEAELVWKCREYICNLPVALPKFLHAVDWADAACVAEAHRMLKKWRLPTPEQSLELLQADFPDPIVRAYAVSQLEKLSDDALRIFMLQLTQVLKFETFLDSSLTRFLLRRSLLNPRKVGHVLFWFLKAEMHIPEVAQRFGAILQQYLLNCGDHRTSLGHQMFVMTKLEDIAMKVKAGGSKEERLNVLRTELPRIVFPERFQLPLSPDMVAKSLNVSKCRVMSSKKLPLWLEFDAAAASTGESKSIVVLFKAGDDLRQDQLTLQILGIMNALWKQESYDLRMSPYLCVSTGDETGMIEVVCNANTLANIVAEAASAEGGTGWSRKFNAAMKVFSKDLVYKEWLVAQNACKWEEVEENFVRSCAGYCVATYVLGIGDRHNDNLMLTKDGKLFHIDFGHFLGNFKSKFGYKRERAPFVFTPGFAAVMGGEGSESYRKFESLACAAYNILRKHGHLFITLFYLMLASGLPELETAKDMDWLREKLMLDATDDEAAEHFRRMIKASLNTKATLINDAVHLLAHA